ncbi:MAG TPA: hypothetical protein VFB66_11300 [Tepidisphaeraceae bacterium]|nr:hypothetical protein [Tepidisphaeraceae bacterium]
MLQALRALLWSVTLSIAGVAVGGVLPVVRSIVGEVAGFAVVALVILAFWYVGDRPELVRQYRRAHGQCERCGYDLRGNETRVCPECGTPFEARAGAAVD